MEKKCPGCKQKLLIERFTDNDKIYSKCTSCRTKLISKKNICEVCGILACYNNENEKLGIRCYSHKESDMVDIKRKKCEKCKKKKPSYNIEGTIGAKYCSDCKEPGMVDVINKKCIKCKSKIPIFNFKDKTTAQYCGDCKEPDMIDIKRKNCEKCNKVRPSFNYSNESIPKFCVNCKEPEMINVLDNKCNKCNKCNNKLPTFNYKNESIPKFCADCKEPEMVNVKDKMCIKCKIIRPTFNYKNETKPLYCNNCKEADMVNVKDKMCIKCNIKTPIFNYENETKPLYCNNCKESDMVNIVSKRCEKCNTKIPTFNYKNESIPKFCNDCKEPDMVNIKKHKMCEKCNIKRPSYNIEGETTSKYCANCKESDMVNIANHKKCEKCNIKRPSYNIEGETIPKFCKDCKNCDMVDVINCKCVETGCRKIAGYAQPGTKPSYCFTHKTEGMMKNPRKKCQNTDNGNCNEIATHGIDKPIHCEKHCLEDEYCLAERKCIKCGVIDILNKYGHCVNICSLVEKDLLMKKRVKRKEEFIVKLLDEEIDLKNDVIEMWRDTIIDSNCTKSRPDFAYHCGTHIVIVEVDEEQHKSYNNCGYEKEEKMKAENIRMYNISNIFQGKPVIFLRYNPDTFKNKDGTKSKINNTKRHTTLIKWIKKCFRNKWESGIYVKYLFYDNYDETDGIFIQITEKDIL